MHENAEATSRTVCDEAPCRYCEKRDISGSRVNEKEKQNVSEITERVIRCLSSQLSSVVQASSKTLKKRNDRVRI